MNSIMISALAASGLLMGQSDATKMDECCPKRTADCCDKKMEGCCEKMLDECCTWTRVPEGKTSVRRRHCVQPPAAPGKVRIEVKPEDRQPGDDWGYKTVGKNTVKVYYRTVDPKPETPKSTDCSKARQKDDCNYAYLTEGKNSVRRSFCEQNGRRVMCGQKPGECGTCVK